MLSRLNNRLNNKLIIKSLDSIVLTQLSLRKFASFDYIELCNDLDSGKTVEDSLEKNISKREENFVLNFDWSWIDWYKDNYPDSLATITGIQNKYRNFEAFIHERGPTSSTKSISFNDFRNEIADPKFVDELEISYNVDKSTLNSIENMHTLEEWNYDSVKLFEEDCSRTNDLLWKPMSSDEKDSMIESLRGTEQEEEKLRELTNEFLKDYEQIDAEFEMYGQETQQMKLSEYPQLAENLEDRQGAKTTYLDMNLLDIHVNFVKREKLRQFQEEERRKEFLDTFDTASKILNGLEIPHDLVTTPRPNANH